MPYGQKEILMRGSELLAARIIVGFNVDNKPTYDVKDLQRVVAKARSKMGLYIAGTFVPQRGFYQESLKVKPIDEAGAQVIILNFYDKLPRQTFVAFTAALARHIRREFHQNEVLVQVTDRGRIIRAWSEKNTRAWRAENRRRKPR